MSSIWVRINGVPATEIGPHTPPSWETLADGGCGPASIAFALPPRAQHHVLKAGALMEIMCGPESLWKGLITEPDRTTWEIQAVGLWAALARKFAIDASGNPTRDMGVAIPQAMARGWQGWNPTPVTGPVAGDPDGNPITVTTLLEDYAEQTGQRAGVDGTGAVYMRPDPTAPAWLAAPGAAAFGASDEDVATRLIGTYTDGVATNTVMVGTDGPEQVVDLTQRGALTEVAAAAILTGMLQRSKGTGWVNSVTLHREQFTTSGGQRAFLPGVRAGAMMRAHGLSHGVADQAPWLDVVIGRTIYTAGADVITVEPIETVPRTLSDVIAATA